MILIVFIIISIFISPHHSFPNKFSFKTSNTAKYSIITTQQNEQDHNQCILSITKSWVQSMISDFGICPYSKSADLAGVPMGQVRYTLSTANTLEQAYEDYWSEVNMMLSKPEIEISTVLLLYPNLIDFNDYNMFQEFSTTLDAALSNTIISEDIGKMCIM